MKLPSKQKLQKLFSYDFETGFLHHKEQPTVEIPIEGDDDDVIKYKQALEDRRKKFQADRVGKVACYLSKGSFPYRRFVDISKRSFPTSEIVWKLFYDEEPYCVYTLGEVSDSRIENLWEVSIPLLATGKSVLTLGW